MGSTASGVRRPACGGAVSRADSRSWCGGLTRPVQSVVVSALSLAARSKMKSRTSSGTVQCVSDATM